MNLNTWENITVDSEVPLAIEFNTSITDPVLLFQSQQTIVATQDTKTYPVKNVSDLYNIPLQLSVALDSNQFATSSYFLEVGPISEDQFEYGVINVTAPGNITFTNLTETLDSTLKITTIEKVIVSFAKGNVNASCAMLKNGTAFALNTTVVKVNEDY